MLSEIFNAYSSCRYDFRDYAYVQDPLCELFEEWVDYYRMKWSIAHTLVPKQILEIGVRYGYSARAFLAGVPGASYTGIDADAPTYGGHHGALAWARESLRPFDAQLINADSQKLKRFPGAIYDLIHVDGQQDGNGTLHDLELALAQGRYILVDGYCWTRENFLAANEWLWLNKAAIEWTLTIPGYAGEFLVKTKIAADDAPSGGAAGSVALASCYTKDYYLSDCGGYREWRRGNGKSPLTDGRLQTVADVVWAIGRPQRVIDLGAGRGELTRHFAAAGAQVTSIDYAKDAIALIETSMADDPAIRKNVRLIHDSVTNPSVYEDVFDVAMASDVIEHLSPAELNGLYELVARHLNTDHGVFVLHTAPNLWNYRYQHPREQRSAIRTGAWLPRTRRTYFERLMHINEQSPRVLKRQLQRFFPNVQVWFSNYGDAGGSLVRRYSIEDCRKATSLFAVASHAPVTLESMRAALQMMPLPAEEAAKVRIAVESYPSQVKADDVFVIDMTLINESGRLLNSYAPNPFNLCYHLADANGENILVFDGLRTPLTPACPADTTRRYKLMIHAPASPGRYSAIITTVQESVRWHDARNPPCVQFEVVP